MSSPDINFKSIRLHRGTQADAFEELCCQLASDEAKSVGADRFVRKGRGADAGVEAFAILPSDREIGWQVKYYEKVDDALRSLSDSLATALAKHPKMDRFIACVPFDLADGRKEDTRTALDRWNDWKVAETAKATAMGRSIDIEMWGAAELKDRLIADPKMAGRVAFWFDANLLTPDWFADKLARALKVLGARYTPATNVRLPIRHALMATVRDPSFVAELRSMIEAIEIARLQAPTGGPPEAASARTAIWNAIDVMSAAVETDPDDMPLADLVGALDAAVQAATDWRRIEWGKDHRSDPARALGQLLARLTEAARRLDSQRWRLINSRALLVTGEGGIGKSHLLADACETQIDKGVPALLIPAHLMKDEDPWAQIVTSLDLPRHLRVAEFLTALNSAAIAFGVRALVVVDGINERGGQAIWSTRLAGFLHDVEAYPWISVVLSCRTTYVDSVIPPELDETVLPRIEHMGFSVADAERYLDMRGVTTLDAPWPLAEFNTPLFLKTLCDGLVKTGQTTLPRGSQGVTRIFALYADAVIDTVRRDLNLNPKLNHVGRAIAAFAAELAHSGDTALSYAAADAIVSAILPHDGGADRDLLFQLIAAGLLATDLYDDGEVVRFTFERFGDFTVASGLIADCKTPEDVEAALAGTRVLGAFLAAAGYQIDGVFEALAVLLPESFGVELPDLPLPSTAKWSAGMAFGASLMTREATAFTSRTWALVSEIGGQADEWDARIRLSTEPSAENSAVALHARLAAMSMPERDASWSAHIASPSEAARQLIDWSLRPRLGALSDARAELITITLAWTLTTSHRALRDRATKGLAAILADRPGLVDALLVRFLDIDDGYVIERLLCAIYGAALQGRWPDDEAAQVARAVDRRVFGDGRPPVNCLAREHGRLLIQWAIVKGALPADFDTGPSSGPFDTPWPIESVPEAVIESFTRTYRTGARHRDEIVASCVEDGDFARYVLDGAVDAWSPARRGTTPLPTRKDLHDVWLRDFEAHASAEQLTAYVEFTKALAEDQESSPWREGSAAISAKKAFAAAIGEPMYERWRQEAESWRRNGMYQAPAPRDFAEFNLAWARRWVCYRAHELGWSETLHAGFEDSLRDGGRMSHRVERIGKKYQWLALYELRARMADNLAPLKADPALEPDELRVIDPSLLAGYRSDEWNDEDDDDGLELPSFEPTPWAETVPLPAVSVDDALMWRDDDEDLPDGLEGLELNIDGRPWLALKRFDSWRGGPETLQRQMSRWTTCVVVRKADLPDFIAQVDGKTAVDQDHITSGEGRVTWRSYLGEYPWLWSENVGDDWSRPWMPGDEGPLDLSVRATTIGFLAESSGHDQSLDVNVDARLPAPWLMEALCLRLGDGRAIEFVDGSGLVVFRDPTAEGGSISAALIDRNAFLDMLRREDLAAVWLIGGEKNIYGGSIDRGFGGRREYARIAWSAGGELTVGARGSNLIEPSVKQLRDLRENHEAS